ncbi:hypothetical protein ACUX4R_28235, partial [Salmonella enterica]
LNKKVLLVLGEIARDCPGSLPVWRVLCSLFLYYYFSVDRLSSGIIRFAPTTPHQIEVSSISFMRNSVMVFYITKLFS